MKILWRKSFGYTGVEFDGCHSVQFGNTISDIATTVNVEISDLKRRRNGLTAT